MRLQIPDVNVVVYAFVDESPRHAISQDWLRSTLAEGNLGLSDLVLSGVVRVLSNRRGSWAGYETADLIARCDDLRAAPGATIVRPGARHWTIFKTLLSATDAHGNLVPDCYHAALAIEHDATWVSGDAFFGQVPGLDWVNPFA